MKLRLLFIFLFVTAFAFAQQTYYNDVNLTLTGIPLRDALATKVINTHVKVLDYTPGVWEADRIVDLDPADATQSNVLLIYGYNDSDASVINDRTRDKNNNGGGTGQWNREHVYPQSLGGFDTSPGPGTDVHHVRASDVQFNGQRGNTPYAAGSGNAGPSGGGWYPGDEWKGDVARMVMYMYLRYGNQTLPNVVTLGSSNTTDPNMVNLLLQWNVDDPVSQVEDNRNNYLENVNNTYGQGNRNPFIDEPFLATLIWGGTAAEDRWGIFTSADTTPPSAPTGLTANNTTSIGTDLTWAASTDDVAVTTYEVFQDGVSIGTTGTTSFNVTGLTASTTYSFTVTAKDAAENTSAPSTALQVTTLASGGGNASDLFFSEYVEGTSNNKALEIANFTGTPIDLSVYTIQKQVNGAGGWTNSYSFPAGTILADGDVFVVANSAHAISGTAAPIDAVSGAPLDFNGNDPLGLFKSGVLIDIIGTFNGGTANFSANETMRRKPTITSPNTTFDKVGEWDVSPSDTFDGLGTHSITLSSPDFGQEAFKIYPNPVSSGVVFIQSNQKMDKLTIYSISGQVIKEITTAVTNQPISLNNLSKGVYLAKITFEGNKTVTRKIVIN